MAREKLEKFAPLSLLALVIVAIAIGLIAKRASDDAADAGFNVISYFSCGFKNFVLIAEEDTFQVLRYHGSQDEVIARGKPTDLTYFTRAKISNAEASYSSFTWEIDNPDAFTVKETYSLDRSSGTLSFTGAIPDFDFSETPGSRTFDFSKPPDKRIPESNSKLYFCKFGEEGKRLVWEATLKKYENLKPKF